MLSDGLEELAEDIGVDDLLHAHTNPKAKTAMAAVFMVEVIVNRGAESSRSLLNAETGERFFEKAGVDCEAAATRLHIF